MVTVNCRGLNNLHKRRDVLNELRGSDGEIFFLQDIHIPPEQHNAFETLWKGSAFFSSYKRDTRGVCILFKKHFPFEPLHVHRDAEGNLLILQAEIYDRRVVFATKYGPNSDCPDFYNNLLNILDEMNGDTLILGGDFNLVMNQSMDTKNYQSEHNTRARSALKNLISKKALTDIWRHFHPNERGYTIYMDKTNAIQAITIGYVLR